MVDHDQGYLDQPMWRRQSNRSRRGNFVYFSILFCLLLPIEVASWCLSPGDWSRPYLRHKGLERKTCQSTCYAVGRRSFVQGHSHPLPYQHQTQEQAVAQSWYPRTSVDCKFVEKQAVALAARLVKREMQYQKLPQEKLSQKLAGDIPESVQDRFRDLTCEAHGEETLERMFIDYDKILLHEGNSEEEEAKILDLQDEILSATVMVFQSLLVLATQVGLTGHPEQLRRLVAHLDDRFDSTLAMRDLDTWDSDSIRRLKYRIDRTPAVELLGALLYKRSPQGAFDLLLELNVFTKHEDLALLRSGFPLRFSKLELQIAEDAAAKPKPDIDSLLGLRLDLRHLKVYTIDGASTSEIDDGVSVEVLREEGGSERYRYWIHIADAERHVNEELWDNVARKRFTSLYLPTGTFPMIPPVLSTNIMSLNTGKDAYALSMGIELNGDGSIDGQSVVLSPSLIRVDYRLTYEEADEMLSEGVAYKEEWELGSLFDMARRRREYRVNNGSIEGLVRNPIPFSTVAAYRDKNAPDGIDISLSVDVSHNAGRNQTVEGEGDGLQDDYSPVSSATLLVTETMILAGEGIGVWKDWLTKNGLANGDQKIYPNDIRLPFRTQPSPDFKSRAREHRIWMDLLKYNVGDGYCYTWYSRRFLQSLKISEEPSPHSGLGLQSYVQWTSPIRRFSDLMTHRSLKRFLRRQRVYELVEREESIPLAVKDSDLGFPKGTLCDGKISLPLSVSDLDEDTNPLEGFGLQGAARTLQRQSQQYWLYEYLRRLTAEETDRSFAAVVLGTVDPERRRYAIFVEELGLEHRYTSPAARLDPGSKLRLRIDTVNPRFGTLTFVRQV